MSLETSTSVMICLNLVLGLFLFQRLRSKARQPPDQTTEVKEHA